MVGDDVGTMEEAKEEGYDGVSDLDVVNVDVDEVEAKVSREGGVDNSITGVKVEDELPGAKVVLGNARVEGEGVK